MSNYNSLKTTINANIKQNGVQAITGNILNSVLNAMVTTLGTGYQFAGVATTATDPSSPDAKVFYIANGKGTYTNFGGISVTEDDVVVLYWDSSWHKVSTGIATNAKLTELERLDEQINGKQFVSGKATTSSTSTVNVVPVNTPVNIPAGTKVKMVMDGYGVYTRYYRYYINGSTAYKEIVEEKEHIVTFEEDVTIFRVAITAANFLALGDVTFTMVADGENLISKVNAITPKVKSLSDNITIEDLKKIAGVSGNDFTSSFTIDLSLNDYKSSGLIFSSIAKYVGNDAPTIKIYYGDASTDSTRVFDYIVGGKGRFKSNSWRLYEPIMGENNVHIVFNIPSGTTLTIKSFGLSHSNERTTDTSFKIFAHTYNWGNFNTALSFEMASKCGFNGAVAVPKRTSDGVWVCYHDDSRIYNLLKYSDGTSISAEKISDCTYADVQRMIYKTANTLGENPNIPTLEEFFNICAKTGLHPMLSCHPIPTSSEWTEIKELAFKCGVLDKLNIKIGGYGKSKWITCFNVFGNNIENYYADISSLGAYPIEDVITEWSTIGWDKKKVGVEFYPELATSYNIGVILGGGYKIGVYEDFPTGAKVEEYISNGVTELTTANIFSGGLNW